MEPENYHITLQFIGEYDDVERVISALRAVEFTPVTIQIAGAGGFPTRERPRVIWIGATSVENALERLADDVRRVLDENNIPHDTKPFHGHVTVARVKRLAKALMETIDKDFGTFKADHFALYQSILTPEGPIYREVARFGEGK